MLPSPYGRGAGGEVGVWLGLFVFYEACSPLPMGEGPGVRSGLCEGFCFWPGFFVGIESG